MRLFRVPPAKAALTELVGALSATLHVLVPEHAPDHPENWLGDVAVAVSVTEVFDAKAAEHPVVDPLVQLIPAGLLVTVPLPLPVVITVREFPVLNVAATFSAAFTVRVHVVVPEHAPLQPAK